MGANKKIFHLLLITLTFSVLPPLSQGSDDEVLQVGLHQKATPLQRCQIQVLEDLGVQFAPAQATAFMAGDTCNASSLAKAQIDGGLKVTVNPSEIEQFLSVGPQMLFQQDAVKCAYKLKLEQAAQTTVQKLEANKKYTFGTCRPTFASAPLAEWTAQGQCILAKNSPSAAIQCFSNDTCRSECAVGLQVAELATLAELFGAEDFDHNFNKNEIALDSWQGLQSTFNPVMGFTDPTHELQRVEDTYAQATAQHGRLFLVGASGYIGNTGGEKTLDSEPNRGENYFIVSVSKEAAAAIAKNSYEHYNKINKQAHDLLTKYVGPLADKNPAANQAKARELFRNNAQFVQELKVLLDDPAYDGVKVFVHPLGVMTLGDQVRRLLKINPRTAYEFTLYDNNMNTLMYDRYIQSKIASCLEKKEAQPQIKVGSQVLLSDGRLAEATHLMANDKVQINLLGDATPSVTSHRNLSLLITDRPVTIDCPDRTPDQRILESKEHVLSEDGKSFGALIGITPAGFAIFKNSDGEMVVQDGCNLHKKVSEMKNLKENDKVQVAPGHRGRIVDIFDNGSVVIRVGQREHLLTKRTFVEEVHAIDQLTPVAAKPTWQLPSFLRRR